MLANENTKVGHLIVRMHRWALGPVSLLCDYELLLVLHCAEEIWKGPKTQ